MVCNGPIGRSSAHLALVDRITKIAPVDTEVLISGPTGVGKELYARLVHTRSRRSEGPFVAVNCGAIPTDLVENELFGHVQGAFTGASARRPGILSAAESGTLFLDEIDALSLAAQVKLLRFVQNREYRPLGSGSVRHSDVRIIAGTNANLWGSVEKGGFREDLYFRLRVVPLEVPPLRDRPEDILVLADHFLNLYATMYKVRRLCLSPESAACLERYAWPGNVRELENCIRYLACLQLDRDVLPDDLAFLQLIPAPEHSRPIDERSLKEAKQELIARFERKYLEDALIRHDGNITRAARASGKARRAFFELMRKHGLNAIRESEPFVPPPVPFTPRLVDK